MHDWRWILPKQYRSVSMRKIIYRRSWLFANFFCMMNDKSYFCRTEFCLLHSFRFRRHDRKALHSWMKMRGSGCEVILLRKSPSLEDVVITEMLSPVEGRRQGQVWKTHSFHQYVQTWRRILLIFTSLAKLYASTAKTQDFHDKTDWQYLIVVPDLPKETRLTRRGGESDNSMHAYRP